MQQQVCPPWHGVQLCRHVAGDHKLCGKHDGCSCTCCCWISHPGGLLHFWILLMNQLVFMLNWLCHHIEYRPPGSQWCSSLEGGVLCGGPGLHRGQHNLSGVGQRQGAELEQGVGWWTRWGRRRGGGSLCRLGWLTKTKSVQLIYSTITKELEEPLKSIMFLTYFKFLKTAVVAASPI